VVGALLKRKTLELLVLLGRCSVRVLIDTNILLSFYDLSSADLDQLRKLVDLVKAGKIELLLPQQVVDEYWRNREGVIADAIKRFQQTKAQSTVPNVIRAYPDAVKLKQAVNAVNQLVKDLTAQVREDIDASSLRADTLVEELFASAQVAPISDEIIERAEKRCLVGNPPGKKGSFGDAINWEWLLAQVAAATGEETMATTNRISLMARSRSSWPESGKRYGQVRSCIWTSL
jgi:predicted nucleic acid-binding protein